MADNKNIYFGFNKPTVNTGGQSVPVEKTYAGSYQPVPEPQRQWTQSERAQIVAALRRLFYGDE